MSSCPRCAEPLEGARTPRCPDGHGTFVPATRLRTDVPARAAATLTAALAAADRGTVRCPQCRDAMRDVRIPVPDARDIHLDGCDQCGGWWFDGDEMKRLEAALARRRAEAPRRKEPHPVLEMLSAAADLLVAFSP